MQLDVRIRRPCRRFDRNGGIGGVLIRPDVPFEFIRREICLTETHPAARIGDLYVLHNETAICRGVHLDFRRPLCRETARSADGIRLDVDIAARDRKVGQDDPDGCACRKRDFPIPLNFKVSLCLHRRLQLPDCLREVLLLLRPRCHFSTRLDEPVVLLEIRILQRIFLIANRLAVEPVASLRHVRMDRADQLLKEPLPLGRIDPALVRMREQIGVAHQALLALCIRLFRQGFFLCIRQCANPVHQRFDCIL